MVRLIDSTVTRVVEYNIKDSAKFIRNASAAANIFAGVCQTASFGFNKKIPDNTRNFMVIQELVETVISTLLMMKTADLFRFLGNNLVDKCVILPRKIPEKLKKPEIIKEMFKDKHFDGRAYLGKALDSKAVEEYRRSIFKCRSGLAAFCVVLGEAAAFSIFTPLITNKIASYIRNNKMKSEIAEQQKACKTNKQTPCNIKKQVDNDYPMPSHITYLR